MTATVSFGAPKDITLGGLDGVTILFPFKVTYTGHKATHGVTTEHSIAVSISGTLYATWGFGHFFDGKRDSAFIKTMFEYARLGVTQKLEEGRLGEHEELRLYTNTAPTDNPFDPQKIDNPDGATYSIEIIEHDLETEEKTPDHDSKVRSEDAKPRQIPQVFVSYSWDGENHKKWVVGLSTRLRENGVDVILDAWHLAPGDRVSTFMESSIRESDLVLIICTPTYKDRSDNRKGGVGYEGAIMNGELLTQRNERKFIPVLRGGFWKEAAPSWMADKYYIDLSGDPYPEARFRDLLTTIHNQRPTPPPIGPIPDLTDIAELKQNLDVSAGLGESIYLEGIIADEVTEPRNDGTRGGGLYTIPFQLSRVPPSNWIDAFIDAWNKPSRFTTMHRPGIARIESDKVILDGTTIEEVERYHRDTLNLAIEAANKIVFG